MLKTIWQDNKRFLLLCGGGLVVFLFLNSCISGYITGADRVVSKSRSLQKKVRLAHKRLVDRYWPESNRAQAYEAHRESLEKEVCLPPDADLPSRKGRSRGSSLIVEFNQAVTNAWAKVQAEANSVGLQLPKKPTAQDFDIRRDDVEQHYRLHYSNLEICSRALEVLVGSGIKRFAAIPQILPEDELPVRENENLVCVYRGCVYRVVGPYESFLRILQDVQKPGAFLQVRIRSLESGRGSEADLLRGELEFIGFRLHERTET